MAGRNHELQTLSAGTVYMPYGTSLRMGRLGYQSDAQASLAVSYNSLEGYAASLHEALTRPYPAYEAIGIVLLVSFVSLGLRAGLVVALSIPLVLTIVFLFMSYFGITLQPSA